LRLVQDGVITLNVAKTVFEEMYTQGGRAAEIVQARGLAVVTGRAALEPLVQQVLAEQAEAVQEYRRGKVGVLGFLVGQVMRATGGKADAKLARALLQEQLGE
ncbi:MAG: hypothetical protein GX605_06105, partial [Chloroflexi bacterium]|nr:hypothetical protein [Chloroflexota bacterium]